MSLPLPRHDFRPGVPVQPAAAVRPPAGPAAQAAPAAPAATARRSIPLGVAGLLLGVCATLLAATAGWGLARVAGAGAPWAAAAAAALAVALAALPLAAIIFGLARRIVAAGEAADAGTQPVAGVDRPLFMKLADREWARARRYGSGAALLLVDIDRHARLNELHGPITGAAVLDELLRQTALTLRGADMLTPFASGQMAVFLAHADATGALDVAERIRERAEQLDLPPQHAQSQQRLRITVSVGVAHLRPAHLNLQAVVDDAEDAVATARQAGGNCVRAAPVDPQRLRLPGTWRDERRAKPKQGGSAKP